MAGPIERLRRRKEWKFFAVLPKADRRLAFVWWAVVLLHGIVPVLFAIATGVLVAAVQGGEPLAASLALAGVLFVLVQVVTPVQTAISHNLGDRMAAFLYDRLTVACVRPLGIAHLEDPALAADLTVARDFDLGMTGPPLSYSMDFIAGGLVGTIGGLAAAVVLFGFVWWAPFVLAGAWMSTHWLLRESSVWHDRNTDQVRMAQRDADYAYRLAVDPPASKELRLFGLVGWTIDRFVARRTLLHKLQYDATRLRERPLALSLLIVTAANVAVLWALASAAAAGRMQLGELVVYGQCVVATSLIAFGGLNWALDGAAAPVAAVERLEPVMAAAGHLEPGRRSAAGLPVAGIRFRDVTFAYPGPAEAGRHAGAPGPAEVGHQAGAPGLAEARHHAGAAVLDGFDLTIPAGSSLAIVGQNGAGKTTLAKLLCRLYDPQRGAIEIDGIDLRDLDVAAWRSRMTAVFQDFIRLELPLRDNVAPAGAPDAVVQRALEAGGAAGLATLDSVLARGYENGIDLSGGQWQRIALARALAAVEVGAGVVILDEPTAQLDVRGEAQIFERILEATRHCTTILISHRFSTVRHADRICVLEKGKVVELGSHQELMALNGRYRTMFDLQAQRFSAEDEEGRAYDVLV
jgi:ATP-binding cassette subfamily B protein